ncbi:hypothetical protein D9M73_108240 [compost metagenome]
MTRLWRNEKDLPTRGASAGLFLQPLAAKEGTRRAVFVSPAERGQSIIRANAAPGCDAAQNFYGSITVSMTWITPLDCITLAMVIRPVWPLASVMLQPRPAFAKVSVPPWTVV